MNIASFLHNGVQVSITVDESPCNPREDSTITTIAHWHTRNNLGDVRIERCTKEEIVAEHAHTDPIVAIKPVYAYDHSGMTLSTTPFSCRWDSGQVGWIYITASQVEDDGEFGLDAVIELELAQFAAYVDGRVYACEWSNSEGEREFIGGLYGELNEVIVQAKSYV